MGGVEGDTSTTAGAGSGGGASGGSGHCYEYSGTPPVVCGSDEYCAFYSSIGSEPVNECRPFPKDCHSCQCAVADTKVAAALKIQAGVSVDWATCGCLNQDHTSIDINSCTPITFTFCVIP